MGQQLLAPVREIDLVKARRQIAVVHRDKGVPTIRRELDTLEAKAARRMPPREAAERTAASIENNQTLFLISGENAALGNEGGPRGVRAYKSSMSGADVRVGADNYGEECDRGDDGRNELAPGGLHEGIITQSAAESA